MFRFDDSPPLSPDGPTARQWLREELAKREYAEHKSLAQRILEWLANHLGGTQIGGVTIPWYVVAGAVVLVLAGVLAISLRRFRFSRGGARDKTDGSAAVFGNESRQDAETYRLEAEHLVVEDPSAAMLAAYRAVVARADDTGHLELRAGTTVGDVDRALTRALPEHADAVLAAGSAFDAVRYGAGAATAGQVYDALALDDVMVTADAPVPGGDAA